MLELVMKGSLEQGADEAGASNIATGIFEGRFGIFVSKLRT